MESYLVEWLVWGPRPEGYDPFATPWHPQERGELGPFASLGEAVDAAVEYAQSAGRRVDVAVTRVGVSDPFERHVAQATAEIVARLGHVNPYAGSGWLVG